MDPFHDDVPTSLRLLLVSGSLRSRSTNTALLRTLPAIAPVGVVAELYDGMDRLPHFNPDNDIEPLDPGVADLRASIRSADALIFSTPEYAGALPGSFKNLLDWTIGDDAPGSIYEKPVVWINASARGAVNAHDSLRKVLGYAGARIVESACVEVPVNSADVGADGRIADDTIRARLADALHVLAAALTEPRAEPRALSAQTEAPRPASARSAQPAPNSSSS